jgi:predicted O-methyltransferase YrrM
MAYFRFANIAKENIVKAGLSNKIEVICGNALDVIPTAMLEPYEKMFPRRKTY